MIPCKNGPSRRRLGWTDSVYASAWLLMVMPGTTAAQEIAPWTEAVVSVRDIRATARLFVDVGGWHRTHAGALNRQELSYWGLPANANGRFARYCAPGVNTGCLRFVRFDGVPQRPIRLAARAWDTGGIYSIMVRSDNVEDLFAKAIALGWWAESEPIRFTYGTSDLRNVVLQGPHGINLAAYERLSPPFTAFPVGRISQAFNAMRMVRSRSVARDFFRELLGFQIVFDSARDFAEPARSNFGIPFNLTPQTPRAAAALQPVAGETGRVEVMQLEGFVGTEVGAHALPPNLGILSVRYPVRGLAALRQRLAARAAPMPYSSSGIPVPALGRVDLISLRDPDGGLTEFYEATTDTATEGNP